MIGEHPSLSCRIVCADARVEIESLGLVLDAGGLSEKLAGLIEELRAGRRSRARRAG